MSKLQDRFDFAKQIPAPDISSKLADRLERSAPPDEEPRIRNRILAAAVATAVFLVAGVFAFQSFDTGRPSTVGAPRRPGPIQFDYSSPSGMGYAFSNIVFRPTSQGWTTEYTMTWENGVWPGQRHCEVTVTDGDGATLKTDSMDFEGLQNGVGGVVETTSQPAGFDATCGPRLDTPVAYVITDPHLSTKDGDPAIEFTASFPAGLPQGAFVGTNECVAAMVTTGAVITAQPFTLTAPDGMTAREWPSDHPGSLDPTALLGATPVIKCEPFQSEASMSSMVDDFVKQIEG